MNPNGYNKYQTKEKEDRDYSSRIRKIVNKDTLRLDYKKKWIHHIGTGFSQVLHKDSTTYIYCRCGSCLMTLIFACVKTLMESRKGHKGRWFYPEISINSNRLITLFFIAGLYKTIIAVPGVALINYIVWLLWRTYLW